MRRSIAYLMLTILCIPIPTLAAQTIDDDLSKDLLQAIHMSKPKQLQFYITTGGYRNRATKQYAKKIAHQFIKKFSHMVEKCGNQKISCDHTGKPLQDRELIVYLTCTQEREWLNHAKKIAHVIEQSDDSCWQQPE